MNCEHCGQPLPERKRIPATLLREAAVEAVAREGIRWGELARRAGMTIGPNIPYGDGRRLRAALAVTASGYVEREDKMLNPATALRIAEAVGLDPVEIGL